MAEVGLAAIALQVLGLAMPLFFQIIIDRVVTHHAEITLHVLALGMLAAIIFEAVFGWLRSYLLLYATSVIDLRLAIRTFEHLTSVALPFLSAPRPACSSNICSSLKKFVNFLRAVCSAPCWTASRSLWCCPSCLRTAGG